MFEYTTEELIDKLRKDKKTAYSLLVNKLKKCGVLFYEDKPYYNVVFEKDNKICKISQYMFYRVGGQCVASKVTKDKNGNYNETLVEFTDQMFYFQMESVIRSQLKL